MFCRRGCDIEAEGVEALASALVENSTLKKLSLMEYLCDKSTTALASALTKNVTLEVLDLDYQEPGSGVANYRTDDPSRRWLQE